MPLTNATLAAHLPAGALTVDGSGNYSLSFSALAPGPASKISFDKPLAVLLEGIEQMVASINATRATATPPLSAIALIAKSIGSANDPTTNEPTTITEDYSIHFEYNESILAGANNDPVPAQTY